jgi:hypothetical protein
MIHYLIGLICCLLIVSVFSEDEKSRKLSLKDINIVSTDVSTNLKKISSTREISICKASSQGGIVTFKSTSKDSLQEEIAYPVEESNFGEISGRK